MHALQDARLGPGRSLQRLVHVAFAVPLSAHQPALVEPRQYRHHRRVGHLMARAGEPLLHLGHAQSRVLGEQTEDLHLQGTDLALQRHPAATTTIVVVCPGGYISRIPRGGLRQAAYLAARGLGLRRRRLRTALGGVGCGYEASTTTRASPHSDRWNSCLGPASTPNRCAMSSRSSRATCIARPCASAAAM